MYDSFIFRGRPLEDFGAEAFWGESYTVGAQIRRPAYNLPAGGSVLIGADVPETRTHNLTLLPAPGVTDTPAWRRNLLQWLQGARGELVWREDPDMVRLARFDKTGSGGTKVSPEGGITLQATLEPLCRTRQESGVGGTTQGKKLTLVMPAETGVRAPLRIVLESSGTLTGATVKTSSGTLKVAGMRLSAGKTIEYYAGDAHGNPASLLVNDAAGYAYLAGGQWGILTAETGEEITIVTTGAEAGVHVYARGWWVD